MTFGVAMIGAERCERRDLLLLVGVASNVELDELRFGTRGLPLGFERGELDIRVLENDDNRVGFDLRAAAHGDARDTRRRLRAQPLHVLGNERSGRRHLPQEIPAPDALGPDRATLDAGRCCGRAPKRSDEAGDDDDPDDEEAGLFQPNGACAALSNDVHGAPSATIVPRLVGP
jgi:hypothetical protein